MGLDELITEAIGQNGRDLDLRPTRELVELMNREDATVPAAVATASSEVAALIDAIVERLRRGGRLVYAGRSLSRVSLRRPGTFRANFLSAWRSLSID